ncbi:unnamed protein product [Clonostachys chloroleuca]|uniref:aspartate transaminase n=1 Tax=Clonostachys chloroleuca TaxID=1926264 RepID=A0AA35M780_9HYPO|nr:unnamed protein product [Clonostachys chloroleuca]
MPTLVLVVSGMDSHPRDILFDSAAEGYAGIAAFQTIAGTGANHLGVLLVARATGIDFTKDQWKTLLRAELSASVRHRLRFATGDLDEEAWAVRQFVRNTSTEFVVAQSFSKNFGLYGERIGALHVVCCSADSRSKVLGSLRQVSYAELTTFPINDANIVEHSSWR